MELKQFTSKSALCRSYCEQHDLKHEDSAGAKYRPHQYRGGWVIPGYGFETSRIGNPVKPENAGDPELACSWENAGDEGSTITTQGWQ